MRGRRFATAVAALLLVCVWGGQAADLPFIRGDHPLNFTTCTDHDMMHVQTVSVNETPGEARRRGGLGQLLDPTLQ